MVSQDDRNSKTSGGSDYLVTPAASNMPQNAKPY